MTEARKTVALAIGHSGRGLEISSALIAGGVMEYAARNGWDVIDLRSWRWHVPVQATIHGVIYDRDASDAEHIARLASESLHCVTINTRQTSSTAPCVAMDHEARGNMAADYFLERDFRNFGLAGYNPVAEWTESLKAFRRRIEESGGSCQAIQGFDLPIAAPLETVRGPVTEQLQSLTYPLGIFCTNDRLAVRVCRWCVEAGLAVPEQAAILGFGNDSVACGCSVVPLSSIEPDYERLGTEAAMLLQRMMEGEAIPPDSVLRVPPKGVVTRRSSDIMAIEDQDVARALRYIWDHYRTPIRPADVAGFCGLPLRSLERRFKQALGRTIMKEVMRRRLSEARDLLLHGDMPSVDIAAHLGFGTPQYFNYQFRKKYGLPPQAYRGRERGKP